MNTYCVKTTWVDDQGNAACIGNDETAVIMADSEEEAIQDAIDAHEGHYEADLGRYHPEAETIGWCVCGRADDTEPWEECDGNFATLEDAVEYLEAEAFALNIRDGYAEFYLDWEENQNPADLYAKVVQYAFGPELHFETAAGNATEPPRKTVAK